MTFLGHRIRHKRHISSLHSLYGNELPKSDYLWAIWGSDGNRQLIQIRISDTKMDILSYLERNIL